MDSENSKTGPRRLFNCQRLNKTKTNIFFWFSGLSDPSRAD